MQAVVGDRLQDDPGSGALDRAGDCEAGYGGPVLRECREHGLNDRSGRERQRVIIHQHAVRPLRRGQGGQRLEAETDALLPGGAAGDGEPELRERADSLCEQAGIADWLQ